MKDKDSFSKDNTSKIKYNITVNRINNPYYKNNKVYFDELVLIVQNHSKTFSNILNAKGNKANGYFWKYRYLVDWINSSLPLLDNDFYKLNTKIYWIFNGLTCFPKCKNCGTDVKMKTRNVKITTGYPIYCCNRCQITSSEFKTDRVNTWKSKYGEHVTSPSQSIAVREKQKHTCLKNYGVEYPMQSADILERGCQTKNKLYGNRYYFDINKAKHTRYSKNNGVWFTDEQINQRKETCLKKYGKASATQSDIVKQHAIDNCLKKYGVLSTNQLDTVKENKRNAFSNHYGLGITSYSQTQEYKDKFKNINYVQNIQNKISATKRKNGTFNASYAEEQAYEILKKIFPDVIRQYRDERYEFSCDFYVPSTDLFVEFNGTWTHGGHEFNEKSAEDNAKLKKWQEKARKSKYYDNAIKNWTVRDKKKFEIARANDLNYMVFWKISEIFEFYREFKSKFA